MKILYALLADDVIKHADGKTSIIGIYEKILSTAAPFVLDKLNVAVGLEIAVDEDVIDHPLTIAILNPDHQPIEVVKANLKMEGNIGNQPVHFPVCFRHLHFEAPGPHLISVKAGELPEQIVEFVVEVIKARGQGS